MVVIYSSIERHTWWLLLRMNGGREEAALIWIKKKQEIFTRYDLLINYFFYKFFKNILITFNDVTICKFLI